MVFYLIGSISILIICWHYQIVLQIRLMANFQRMFKLFMVVIEVLFLTFEDDPNCFILFLIIPIKELIHHNYPEGMRLLIIILL